MPSYVITGSSKGIGFAFLENLAKNPSNTVVGLARNKPALEAKLKNAGITNVHVLEGDVGELVSMKKAAEATKQITGGSLDIFINNAGLVSEVSEFKTLSDFDADPQTLEDDFLASFRVNALGVLHSVQAFLPLIRLGSIKKVINISTGIADLDIINDIDFSSAAPYAASKAAANVVIAKYNAEFGKSEGILFLSISPGYVATERNAESAEGNPEKAQELGMKFAQHSPHFKRPLTTDESVTAILNVVDSKSVAAGDGGKFVSHLGTQQWL